MSDLQHGQGEAPDDDYDGPVYDAASGRRLGPLARILAGVAIVAAVGAIGGLVWFAYSEGVRSGVEVAAPVLRADPAPVKRKPLDPGGMDIPHQDKLVYDRIAPGQAQAPVERLLPPPETPVARPEPAAETSTGTAVEAPSSDAVPAESKGAAADAPATTIAQAIKQATEAAIEESDEGKAESRPFVREVDSADVPAAVEEAGKPEAIEAVDKAPATAVAPPQQVAALPAPPTETTKPEPAAGPVWRVQLASLASESAARKEWARLQKANSDLLGALELKVQQVTVKSRSYHRIQAGPLVDRTVASALCGELKARKQDCLIVAP